MHKVLFVDYDEIGAFLFRYAKAINDYNKNLKAYYLSFGNFNRRHDSNSFHFCTTDFDWNFSRVFPPDSYGNTINHLDEKIDYLKKVASDVKPDVVFTSGRGGYLCYKSGLRYCYWAYGSDIEQFAFGITSHADSLYKYAFVNDYINSSLDFDNDSCAEVLKENIWYQGIKNADKITILPRALKNLRRITKEYRLFHLPHLVDSNNIKHDSSSFDRKIFFSSTRHCWGGGRHYMGDNKGNDVLLNAVALYKHKSGDSSFELRLIEKGPDVNKSRELVNFLGLGRQTTWLKEISRDKLKQFYREATICFGQFGTDCLENNTVEPMSFGVPTISWYGMMDRFPFTEIPFYKSSPPIINSKDPEAIACFLFELLKDRLKYIDVRERSFDWCLRNCSVEQVAETFSNLAIGNIELVENRKYSGLLWNAEHDDAVKKCYSNYCNLYLAYQNLDQKFHAITKHILKYAPKRICLSPPYKKEMGNAWTVSLREYASISDNSDNRRRSSLLLIENGNPLLSNHAHHDEVRNVGNGAYSHWLDTLFFSTTDNSDPNTNGRVYEIVIV